MAQAGVCVSEQRKMIFSTPRDASRATILMYAAFLFTGFQCMIYGMLTVPISGHFGINASMIVFFDSFGLWGQILAMAVGGMIISKIKGKNTLLLAGFLMIVGSIAALFSPNIYIYTAMSFICNLAVGFVLVSCYYMMMGTVTEEGKSEGKLSILNVFFSGGCMISPLVTGFVIGHFSWKSVFEIIAAMFVVLIIILLSLNIGEVIDKGAKEKKKTGGFDFLSLPLILTAIAFFLLVYVEQILNYFNQPHLQLDLMFEIELVGGIVTTYAVSQMAGRLFFGKFLLPKVRIHLYIIIASLLFAGLLFLFLHVSSVKMVFVIIAFLGLADSCLYPSILGFGLDQIKKVTPAATAFMVTIGSIGIPFGTAGCGYIGAHFSRMTAMMLGPILLIVIAILIAIVKYMHALNARKVSTESTEEVAAVV